MATFFAAWKTWDDHLRTVRTKRNPADAQNLQAAAAAEGRLESLLVRLALEHRLGRDELATLWCMRWAMKQLRRSIRTGGKLRWWRSEADIHGDSLYGHRAYSAFKNLMGLTANILLKSSKDDSIPAWEAQQDAMRAITMGSDRFTADHRFAAAIEREAQTVAPAIRGDTEWQWLPVAEALVERQREREQTAQRSWLGRHAPRSLRRDSAEANPSHPRSRIQQQERPGDLTSTQATADEVVPREAAGS
jgi:hypothetical protein